MPARVRVAFASCPPQAEVVRRVGGRFGAVAEVEVYECPTEAPDTVLGAIREAAPHVVIADPKPAAYLAGCLGVPVAPFALAAETLLPRIDAALRQSDVVGVFPMAGVASPSLVRFLELIEGAVHVFPWDDHAHMRDLLGRAKRMGIRSVIGGGSLVPLARDEGLEALSIYEEPGETDGVISRMIVRATLQSARRALGRHAALPACGLILEKICQGAIGPHDAALCLDARGVVRAVFARPGRDPGGARASLTLPTGVSIIEALAGRAARFAGHPVGETAPLQVDLYPLAEAGGEGYVAVLRGEPRPDADGGRDPPAGPSRL